MIDSFKDRIVILGYGEDWNGHMLSAFDHINNVEVINERYPYPKNKLLRGLCKIHFSQKVNKYCTLPNKQIWHRQFCKRIAKNKTDRVVVVIYDYNPLACESSFILYLRKYFKNIVTIFILINIAEKFKENRNGLANNLRGYYDRIYTYSKIDALTLGYEYQPNIYPSRHFSKHKKIT